jgi:hypothetical protein
MSKKLIYLASFVLVLSIAGNALADLVAHWSFDDGSGTIAQDLSGNGNDGTLQGDPQWVAGKYGSALEFDGDDFVDCGNQDVLNFGTGDWTITAWIKTTQTDRGTIFANGGDNSGGVRFTLATHEANDDRMTLTTDDDSTKAQALGGTVVIDGQWYHVAAMREGTTISVYVNGVLDGTNTVPAGYDLSGTSQHNSLIGAMTSHTDGSLIKYYVGVIDDERIYNHALTEVEIQVAMKGTVWPYAIGPVPADGEMNADTWANLSWSPGELAVSHDVYFGDNFDDVSAGAENTFQGNQASTFLVVGFPGFSFPDGLVPGTTYYWRVDEVNDTEPNSPWKGDVWSFMIPPKTAYYPDPADAAESIDPDADLSWTAGFGSKLHTVYFGESFDDVNSAAGGLPQGAATYDPGTLKLAKTYYWRVDEFDAIETYKGDVWSFTTQGAVGSPNPANGAVDVKQTQIITFSPSVFAASHELYFGTDKDAVKNADTGSPEYKGTRDLGAETYDPGMLEWDTTYYWRIDEVNSPNPDSPWTGILWSFTTANFLIVDDFESYNDIDPPDPGSNRIFEAWLDGYEIPTNGALVGNDLPPYAEQTIVHGGNQSMPLYYDNSVGYSEATLTLTYPRDWTEKGVNRLTIWFRGDSANAAEALYVALNGTAVVNHENPNAAQVYEWTQWNIPLQAFADQGVNLANVNTISLGLGNKNNPQAGGSGTMYFDDIRLYLPVP